ncbi:MAG: ABC transporter permease [Spirochaetes bacterium]|nr:ABC transporter permease [Spirochaetota bacterium]
MAESKTEKEKWSLVITPRRKFFNINIRELISYRELVLMFVKRDFITQYKQTILGPLWYVISPFISAIIFTFVFGNLAGIGTDGIPHLLFYYSGILLWNFFTACFSGSSDIFISNAHIFGRIYYPRLVAPINQVLSTSIKSFIQLLLLIAFFIYYISIGTPLYPSWRLLLFPMLLIWLAAAGVGAGLIISSITTKYRDLRLLVSYVLGLAMYAAPVVYPLSEIPEQFLWIAYLNPVSAPIELFRQWFFGFSSVSNTIIWSNLGITAVLFLAGLTMFNQNEANFIDVI